jgi:hypothetical protein
MKKGNTHIIVSSGLWIVGSTVRSKSRSEVLQIDIEFKVNNRNKEDLKHIKYIVQAHSPGPLI